MHTLRTAPPEFTARLLAQRLIPAAIVTLLFGVTTSWTLAADTIDFKTQILPIFKKQCYSCHGPDKQESGLRLDRRQEALAGGDSGAAIVPGDPASGHLLKRVESDDGERVMPPKGDRLSEKQIKLLKTWIEGGAKWPDEEDSNSIRMGLPSKIPEHGSPLIIADPIEERGPNTPSSVS